MKEKNPILSIIIPCYKKAEYLPETLKSILNSDFNDFEIIIVDDGSPDNTKDIAFKFIQKDLRIKYLRQENSGVSAARNFGILNSKGKYIFPLDPDDLINSKYISLAINELEKDSNLTLVYCKAKNFKKTKYWKGNWFLGNYNFIDFLGISTIFNASFFRKKDFDLTEGYDTNMKHGLEDWEFWINLLSKTNKKVKQLDYYGFIYRIASNNSRGKEYSKNEQGKQETINYIYQKHKEIYQKFYGNLSMEVIMEMAYYKYKIDRIENKIKNIIKPPFLTSLIKKLT